VLTDGTVTVLDHEDAHTLTTVAPIVSVLKSVVNMTTGQDPGSNASPGDTLRYTITIQNKGRQAAQLLTRHWVITDSNQKVQEVRGDGVVGEQPLLKPGEQFVYTSGTMLETAVGTMKGSYQMLADDGSHFDAEIDEFVLSTPRVLH